MNQVTRCASATLAALSLPLFPSAIAQAQELPTRAPQVATVTSKDGTTIAYERSGQGPAVILIACSLADRSGARALAKLLAPHATVFNYDRRGRGQSGDGKVYAVAREVEDIAALIAAAGGPVTLFGSSSGAALALEAADALGDKVRATALFEPPYVIDDSRAPIPATLGQEIAELVAKDRRSDAVAKFMSGCLGVPDEGIAGMKKAPMWRGMEKLAHTIPYDCAIVVGLQGGKPLPAERWRSVTAAVLVIDGEQSDAFLRHTAAALAQLLPKAKRHTLVGQDHSAVFTAPQALVAPLVELLAAPPAPGSNKKLEERR